MRVLCTFFSDKFSVLKEHWQRESDAGSGGAFYGTDRVVEVDIGGRIAVFDWNTKSVCATKRISTPRNVVHKEGLLYLPKGGQEVVVLSESLEEEGCFSNQHFNNLHWIADSPQGFLFACSGLDLVLETNSAGRTVWTWWGMDHGFDVDPKGRRRVLDKEQDFRNVKFATLRQATHLNSVAHVGETAHYSDTVYVSLFHQGQVIAVDRSSGEHSVVLRGLSHPHAIRECGDCLLVSDTENERVMVADKNFSVVREVLVEGVEWIQDACPLSNGNLLVADSNGARLLEVEVESSEIVSSFKYDEEWKIFSVVQLGA